LLCPRHKEYTGRASTDRELEILEREIIDDLKPLFPYGVNHGVCTESLNEIRYRISNIDSTFLFLRNPRTTGGRFIEGSKRVYVLNHFEWVTNQRLTENPSYLGRYLYAPAVILLHSNPESSNSWCRNVLIHEILHSVSLYSRIWEHYQNIISKHHALIEGINECLTGYVLFKKHPQCYSLWKLNRQGYCQIAYREITKLFCSLAQIVGIDALAKFYLSSEHSFSFPWNRFIESIRSAGFGGFTYALDEATAFREPSFREECIKSIPSFKKLYDSHAKSLDFSRIP
jgi:hypothetical protein